MRIVAGLAVLFVAGTAGPIAMAAPPLPAADPTVAALETSLLRAPDATRAAAIADELESLRNFRLSPTTLLLLHRAQRELGQGAIRDARADIDDALELQPDQALLWRERAAVRAIEGDADGAVADLGGALGRDHDDVPSWSALSEIEQGRSQPRQAFEAWERVLELDPMIEGGAARLQRLHRQLVGAPS